MAKEIDSIEFSKEESDFLSENDKYDILWADMRCIEKYISKMYFNNETLKKKLTKIIKEHINCNMKIFIEFRNVRKLIKQIIKNKK